MIPSQKIGMLTPVNATARVRWSGIRSFRVALMIPVGTPRITANSIATDVSSIVAGKRWDAASGTGRQTPARYKYCGMPVGPRGDREGEGPRLGAAGKWKGKVGCAPAAGGTAFVADYL